MPQQTPAQRAAAMSAAGLSQTQQAGVISGAGYTGATTQQPVYSQSGGAIIPQGGQAGTPAPAPAPAGMVTNASGVMSPAVTTTPGQPQTTAGAAPDTTFAQAQQNIAPTAPPTQQSFFEQLRSQIQPALDKVAEAEQASETAANAQAAREMSSYVRTWVQEE